MLTCIRYIELNPLRAAMVACPENYHWSSIHGHLNLLADRLLIPHPVFLALGPDSAARALRYRDLLMRPSPPKISMRFVATCSKNAPGDRHDFRLWSKRPWGGPLPYGHLAGRARQRSPIQTVMFSDPFFGADSNGNVL
jgi:hypothetical protein